MCLRAALRIQQVPGQPKLSTFIKNFYLRGWSADKAPVYKKYFFVVVGVEGRPAGKRKEIRSSSRKQGQVRGVTMIKIHYVYV